MKFRHALLITLIATLFMVGCGRQPEVSQERFTTLLDTLQGNPDYETYMDASYELSKYYPQERMVPRIFLNAFERAIMEQDGERFDAFFELLKAYPDSGVLSISDQIAFGNRIAWDMTEQMSLFNKAPDVMDYAFQKFETHKSDLQWQDEIGAMLNDTQGNVFENMNEPEKAIEAYGRALEFFEQPETFLRRGLIQETLGNMDAALEDYVSAMSLAPNQVMLSSKVRETYAQLNPNEDVDQFMHDIIESFQEMRREEVLAEMFTMDAPEFEITDMDGNLINNETTLGKVVLVDFWATWCNPCRKELPEYQKLYDIYKVNPKVAFIAASTDSDQSKVEPYVEQMDFSFPVGFGVDAANKFGVEGIPCLFIIGPEGKIRYKIVGFDPDKDFVGEMTWRIESLLY